MDNKIKYLSSMVFNPKTWQTLFGPHRFRIPEYDSDIKGCGIHHFREFRITDSYLGEWNQLFRGGSSPTIVPYSFHWPWMMEFLMHHLLPQLGLNLRNVLHLRQEAEFLGEYKNSGSVYSTDNRLTDICLLEKNRIMLVTNTTVADAAGNPIFKSTDFTIVLNVPEDTLEELESSTCWNQTGLEFMKNGFRRKKPIFPGAEDAECRMSFYCDDNFWLRFGIVSGAVSLTHGYWIISRYFRKHEPFLQGMCTANLVLYLLVRELGETLSRFEVSFNDKLYFPQNVELRFDSEDFELFDEQNRQVAFGRRRRRA